jgi:hypothetical protein
MKRYRIFEIVEPFDKYYRIEKRFLFWWYHYGFYQTKKECFDIVFKEQVEKLIGEETYKN